MSRQKMQSEEAARKIRNVLRIKGCSTWAELVEAVERLAANGDSDNRERKATVAKLQAENARLRAERLVVKRDEGAVLRLREAVTVCDRQMVALRKELIDLRRERDEARDTVQRLMIERLEQPEELRALMAALPPGWGLARLSDLDDVRTHRGQA